MIRSKLTSRYYTSKDVFDEEQEKLFGRLWNFVGLTDEVPKDNSYIVKKVAGKSVIVQRFGDKIEALENTCPHRLTPIHWDESGSRPLVCKYHGWSFDSEGKLRRIPFEKEVYRYTEAEKKNLCLSRFSVELIGKFIFVNLSPSPIPIEKQIVPVLQDQLRDISAHFDSRFEKRVSRRRFNWKLVYENLRDGLHVPFVHPRTLSNLIEYDVSKIPVRVDWSFSLAGLSHGGADAPIPELPPEDWHQQVKRWTCGNFYHNWLIYPNLHVLTATCGNSFSIEFHDPISPTETDVHLYFVTAARKNQDWDPSPVLNGHYDGSETILSEDYAVLEKLQENLAHTDRRPSLGAYEWWNFRIESWYLRAIGHAGILGGVKPYLVWPLRVLQASWAYTKKHGWSNLVRQLSGKCRELFWNA